MWAAARRPILLVRVLAAATLLLMDVACGGKLFRNDHRIEILEPGKYATVSQPLTVRWRAKDFDPPTDGRFLVFVDRDPQPPGQTIAYFRRDRDDIYETSSARLVIQTFTPRPGANDTERNLHDVTVVLTDTEGRRVGESAGFVEFTVRR